MANPDQKWFYNSKEWKQIRLEKLASVGYICEECGAIAEEVHHIRKITNENIVDTSVTFSLSNLLALCKHCHNDIHNRFRKTGLFFDLDGNPILFE